MTEARRFPRACVASPHYLASAAGLEVLASGGNAVDAAVATSLTLGVVAPYLCGYGGDLFAIVWDTEQLHGYNGSGRAPAAASPERFGVSQMPTFGPLSVTVPGAVDGWFALLERFGTRTFTDLCGRALGYARDGFILTERGAQVIGYSKDLYTQPWAEAWRNVYADAEPGTRLVQPALARTIETLASDGPGAYYRGPIGAAIAATLASHGALMSPDDLAAHRGDWVEPLAAPYRGVTVCELPPNSQGVVALEALRMLEGFDLGPPDTPDRHHLLLEATKLALADRNAHITDPEHMRIDPSQLFSDTWIAERRDAVDRERASDPVAGRAEPGGTIYLCAADGDGMAVSLIQSNFVGFGSGVTVPDWGINLQNRGSSFSLDPEDVNVVAPGKRPRHTLMPAALMRDGELWGVFGTMGGDGQAQTHVQVLTRLVDDTDDVQRAISAPRWVVSPGDWSVGAESRFADELLDALRARGHRIDVRRPYDISMGHAHGILRTPEGDWAAGTDPRAEGAALGL